MLKFGENFALSELKDFSEWVISATPYTPELIPALAHAPQLFDQLFQNYLIRAKSSQWSISNPFAAAIPALDAPLAALITDNQAFELLASIMRGAEWKGHGPMALANSSFSTLPTLKIKAKTFAAADPTGATAALVAQQVEIGLADYLANHLV